MDYICTVKQIDAQPTMRVRGTTTVAAISATIGDFLGEVWPYIEANGGGFAGPPYTRYHRVTGSEVEFEAGLPVVATLPDKGRVRADSLPGGEVVSTMHLGPYEQLPAAGAALAVWAEQQGREAAGPNWEIYWTDPGAVQDPAEWQTEVIMPLKPKAG